MAPTAIESEHAHEGRAQEPDVGAREVRHARTRSYLMCPPTYFDVVYAINEWMHPDEPVDRDRAMSQWSTLVDTYRRLGHEVLTIDPVQDLPDMVFVTDSGLVVDGVALGARYRSPERRAEAEYVFQWFRRNGLIRPALPRFVNEGEGDFLVVGDTILAGTGFRSDPRSHAEASAHLDRPVITLELVNPRYYHLNTALGVLDESTIAYLPAAFSAESRAMLERMYPDAVIAAESDTEWLGLNLVSDGANVVLPVQATHLAQQLSARGYEPVQLDYSEFLKSGGGIKCCTLELRGFRELRDRGPTTKESKGTQESEGEKQ
ncbi:N-dimethylarginine dimethylaminohydrolase [Rhodococcus sp. WMMA185]|uniref:dimethylargininase n=1 Tax=Rhodococcus sp. WMMA185 TaxID=679318 RepID=UPI000878BCCA|nr:dimethylargininase [Rhodococcus sp. WMMA185]AOW92105.1 N-dimethylarginine dimethylaminohydrolase [Rhodococcus sp. WMMA185]